MKNILIVGGGAGGLMSANAFARSLPQDIRKGEIKVTIIDPAEYHEFQPGYIGIAFKGSRPSEARRKIKSLLLPGIDFINAACEKIDPDNHNVTISSGMKLSYDYLIVATGCYPDYSQISGLENSNMDYHSSAEKSAKIYRRISEIKGGNILTGIAGLPYKCPPSPNETAFLLDEFFTKRGMRRDVNIKFITPYMKAYPAEPINEVIDPLFRERGIDLVTGFTLDSVNTDKKTLVSLEGDEIKYDDLFLVPPNKPADFLKGSPFCDEDGWIRTDKKDLHIDRYGNAFAIGDSTNIPISKAGVEAHLQSVAVTRNIISEIRRDGQRYEFTGRTQCSMETGYEEATFVIGSYAKPVKKLYPSRGKYFEKKMMEMMYWESLQGSMELLFKLNFGDDYIKSADLGL
ncbi:MAG: NAD(P)/FAD-dependent oxidoreductase [Thermoplasmata archaeon]